MNTSGQSTVAIRNTGSVAAKVTLEVNGTYAFYTADEASLDEPAYPLADTSYVEEASVEVPLGRPEPNVAPGEFLSGGEHPIGAEVLLGQKVCDDVPINQQVIEALGEFGDPELASLTVCTAELSSEEFDDGLQALKVAEGMAPTQAAAEVAAARAARISDCGVVDGEWDIENRFEACRIRRQWMRLDTVVRGQEKSFEAYWLQFRRLTTDRSQNLVTESVKYQMLAAQGPLKKGITVWTVFDCTGCSVEDRPGAYYDSWRISILNGENAQNKSFEYEWHMDTIDTTGSFMKLVNTVEAWWNAVPAVKVTAMRSVSRYVRCDKAKEVGGTGCVWYEFTPTFELSKSGVAEQTARHIELAQSRLGGSPGVKPNALTRHYWNGYPNLNRREAIKKCKAQEEVGSCDEYPFASTYQGCWDEGWENCHVKGIDLSDNRRGGTRLWKFYNNRRVINGDPFYVEIVA